MLPRVRLSEVLRAFLGVKPNRQDRLEGIEGMANPPEPPRVLLNLFLLILAEPDSGPTDSQGFFGIPGFEDLL